MYLRIKLRSSDTILIVLVSSLFSFLVAAIVYRLVELYRVSRKSSMRKFSAVAARLPEKSQLHIIHKNVAFVTHPDGYSIWKVDKDWQPSLIAMKNNSDLQPNPFMAGSYRGWAYIYVKTEGYTAVYKVKNLIDTLSGKNSKILFRNNNE